MKENILNISGEFTCRHHAVRMGAARQAVPGRGVVHEDRQRGISCKWGEVVAAEHLAGHSSLASIKRCAEV